MKTPVIILTGTILVFGGFLLYRNSNQFPIPKGESMPFEEALDRAQNAKENTNNNENNSQNVNIEIKEEPFNLDEPETTNTNMNKKSTSIRGESNRKIMVTDGVKHSIPLNEILSGGPPKDGIPSIDNPKFINPNEADEFLDDNEIGLGVNLKGESRFYPNQIMVWHEITNDTIQGEPVLVTYCPLCATGIVFERKIDGQPVEFGVSGRLWQSNLLMYNRSSSESLWSQVLGEAVLGEHTSQRLNIIPSDVVRYGEWKKAYPDTKVLSRDTGTVRSYGSDPYGNYYTNEDVSFGAKFTDNRLHPKDFVLGVEHEGQFKAYLKEVIPIGKTSDTFAGKTVTINKTPNGEVSLTIGSNNDILPTIGGFWFSWVAVHPNTELYK
ncbi:MAG: hypothetical protein COV57_00665 [Candidatus Liptonbacteria bacterium CG11_big_fil_rev_8_21_14_0_20_35_14]|uniref:DUF3179 domain-containing protein n=1 Tax=Candidatus Liptonbacteria bacterium CG11_big_fil_rev_8_21_14_0_20_35_14 TaxID=1974634 RepID=A0A2H0N8C3_9BACT|nr:MAG: hypothetical protein COV57_00665 [Candidatus Liptonbacteria bacterium CG11_big_fil_rev_8_21_14_0_20_35_14]